LQIWRELSYIIVLNEKFLNLARAQKQHNCDYAVFARSPSIIYNYSALFTNNTIEKNELQPITTVSVDHVLTKIDLGMGHVLIRVENETEIGTSFRPCVIQL